MVHVAVKNCEYMSVKVLFGWLMQVEMKEILNRKDEDEDGNTILHIATLTNRLGVTKLQIKHKNVNSKNLEGLTALDIFHDFREPFQHNNNEEVGKILRFAKAKRASSLSGVTRLADHLSQELTIFEWRDRCLNVHGNGHCAKSPRNYFPSTNMTTATTTSDPMSTGHNFTGSEEEPHLAGQMIRHGIFPIYSTVMNTAAFLTSAWTILVILL